MKTDNIVLVLALAVLLCGCGGEAPKTTAADTRPLVRVGVVSNGVEFVDSLKVQGTVRAKHSAKVSARIPGAIDALLVKEGDAVKAGTPLFRVDQVNLANAVRAARDDLAMAKAKLAQCEATDAKAALDLRRMTTLLKDGAVTRDAFEKAEVAAKSYAAAILAAKATVTKAETGLAVAEKNFADGEIRAPFDGVVTRKYADEGDFIGAGRSVLSMDDTAAYEIALTLNAAEYPRVTVGETTIALAGRKALTVNYKAPSVSSLTRTFEIRADLALDAALAAGMLLDAEVVFARRRSQAIPASAVAWRDGGDCIYEVKDGKVVRVPVTPGLSADGLREIRAPKLSPADKIITEGMLLVNESDAVRTVSD